MRVSSLFLLSLALVVAAHQEPKTPEEIRVQRALQAAAYYVSRLVCVHHHII